MKDLPEYFYTRTVYVREKRHLADDIQAVFAWLESLGFEDRVFSLYIYNSSAIARKTSHKTLIGDITIKLTPNWRSEMRGMIDELWEQKKSHFYLFEFALLNVSFLGGSPIPINLAPLPPPSPDEKIA